MAQVKLTKSLIITLLVYTAVLCGIYAVYAFGEQYELFMQTLDTLWPVIGFTLLLLMVIANALMLARGIPLWLLGALHMVLMAVWVASVWLSLRSHAHESDDGHVCGFPWWLIPIPLIVSTFPPLLGHLLLQIRKRRLLKKQQAEAEQFAFQSPADILAEADAEDEDEDDAEGYQNDDDESGYYDEDSNAQADDNDKSPRT